MEFDEFLRSVAPALDLNWRKYRRRAARRAVAARVRELGLADLSAYLERVRADEEEARTLPDRMRVTVSRFLRERERWEALVDRVVPDLLGNRDTFRVWSAGCCGGEEPYTLVLLWLDRLAARFPGIRLDVLATDIDPAALERAKAGTYETGSLREVPDDLRVRWFHREGIRWRVAQAARTNVRFYHHDLMADPPPQDVDLALCRYLPFTYFRGVRRLDAGRRLHQALRPGGALMIGRKEGLGPEELLLFSPWPEAPGVFRSTEAGRS